MSEELQQLRREISSLRLGRSQGRSKPHQPALLLAVLDLAEDGLLNENKVWFNDALFSRFTLYFDAAREGNDWSQISMPFFHLRQTPFWCHKVKAGREEAYDALKTSGGGTKRITDNIEYAYLSDYAFACVQNPVERQQLREIILELFSPETAERMKTLIEDGPQKIGTMFHESLLLKRAVLKEVLRIAVDSGDQKPNFDTFRENSKAGKNYIKATRRYAAAASLLDDKEKPTDFGRCVYAHDVSFARIETLWMLHYFLSAPHGKAPHFWNELAAKYLSTEGELSSKDVRADIERITKSLGAGLAEDSIKTTANAFLGTYASAEGLGGLNILTSVGQVREGRYVVGEEFAPRSSGVVVCALGDFWAARFGDSKKVNLNEVTGAQGLAPLLLMSSGELLRALGDLQAHGLVALERATAPFQIARSWETPQELWEKLYA